MKIQTWKPFFNKGTWSEGASSDLLEGRHEQREISQRMLITKCVETGDAVGGRKT